MVGIEIFYKSDGVTIQQKLQIFNSALYSSHLCWSNNKRLEIKFLRASCKTLRLEPQRTNSISCSTVIGSTVFQLFYHYNIK